MPRSKKDKDKGKGKATAEPSNTPPKPKGLTSVKTWLQMAENNQTFLQQTPLTTEPISSEPMLAFNQLANILPKETILLLAQSLQNVKKEPSSAIEVSKNHSPLATQKQAEYKRISSEVVIRPQATPPSQRSKFFPKTSFQKILTVEDGFFDEDPIKFAKNIFPKNWLFKPHNTNKTLAYYEQILVETESARFTHFADKNNTENILYSTISISKVIHPSHWGASPHTSRKFQTRLIQSLPYSSSYTYWDYQQAWWNVFFRQNTNFQHTWLVFFKNNFSQQNLPN